MACWCSSGPFVWTSVAIVGALIVLGIVGALIGSSRSSTRRAFPPPAGGLPETPPDKSPFEYDEDDPMDWWDNQYGEHGFKD
jgi:hypothetical protein